MNKIFVFILITLSWISCAQDPDPFKIIPHYQIRYKVEGSVPTASISIFNEEDRSEIFPNTSLPWEYEFSKKVTAGTYLYISAQHGQSQGVIVVVIFRDNIVFKSDTSMGEYATATASGTL